MWSQSTNVTDRQTDRRTTCDRKTALCTKVHCAVIMLSPCHQCLILLHPAGVIVIMPVCWFVRSSWRCCDFSKSTSHVCRPYVHRLSQIVDRVVANCNNAVVCIRPGLCLSRITILTAAIYFLSAIVARTALQSGGVSMAVDQKFAVCDQFLKCWLLNNRKLHFDFGRMISQWITLICCDNLKVVTRAAISVY